MTEAPTLLDQLEQYADIDPLPACWIETDNGSTDAEVYCEECAGKELAKHPGAHLCGDGDSWPESDGCMHCATCGVLLGYTLTDCGVGSELAHFRDYPPEAPLDREVAFHIARVLAGACGKHEAEALALARHAAALIPQEAVPSDR